jgi:hypothetical protein
MSQYAYKVDRIAAAYSKLRISGLTVDPNPSDLELALAELESMMAELASRGIEIGYNFELDPDPNSDLGVPQQFWNMINCNLAVRLIADFNKQVPDALMMQASQSMANASARCAADRIRQVQYPSRQPVGSGNSIYSRWQRFYGGDVLPPNAPSTLYIMQGETNDFAESFESYLRKDEVITSFAVVCDTGLTVVASANATPVITYRLSAPIDATAGVWQQVKVTVTTDVGRVEIRLLNFEVIPYVQVGT